MSDDEIAHLYSIAEALLGRAQKAAREHRQSGGKFPPEFIVKALHDDAALIQEIAERLERARSAIARTGGQE